MAGAAAPPTARLRLGRHLGTQGRGARRRCVDAACWRSPLVGFQADRASTAGAHHPHALRLGGDRRRRRASPARLLLRARSRCAPGWPRPGAARRRRGHLAARRTSRTLAGGFGIAAARSRCRSCRSRRAIVVDLATTGADLRHARLGPQHRGRSRRPARSRLRRLLRRRRLFLSRCFAQRFGLSFWEVLPLAGMLAASFGIAAGLSRCCACAATISPSSPWASARSSASSCSTGST